MRSTDLLIIGGGPAGISTALESHKKRLDCLLVSDEPLGGLTSAAEWITNLPEFPAGISGRDYRNFLVGRITDSGLNSFRGRIERIHRTDHGFKSHYGKGIIHSRSVVLASGTMPSAFDMPGLCYPAAENILHRDIRSLPDCLEGSAVLVIGGGETAVDSALSAQKRGAEVNILCRNNRLKISRRLNSRLGRSHIQVFFRASVEQIKFCPFDPRITVHIHGRKKKLYFNHILISIGRSPRDLLWRELAGQPLQTAVQTSIEGFFLAGDLIRGKNRYIPNALADGRSAAKLSEAYLKNQAPGDVVNRI